MQEAGTGFASKPQTDDAEAGDIALDSWVRYDDPEVKTFKLNAERQNGRAAMLGITGCLIHELLGVDALYPTGAQCDRARSSDSASARADLAPADIMMEANRVASATTLYEVLERQPFSHGDRYTPQIPRGKPPPAAPHNLIKPSRFVRRAESPFFYFSRSSRRCSIPIRPPTRSLPKASKRSGSDAPPE